MSKSETSQADFEVMWQLYKDMKKSTGERNTLLLVDMMEADEGFYMTKEIWNEFKEIFIDYSNYQYEAKPRKQKERDESLIFWRYFQHHVKGPMGVGEAKQAIADEFGWSFDRVDKVIKRKWKDTYSKKREYYENAWSSLKDKP